MGGLLDDPDYWNSLGAILSGPGGPLEARGLGAQSAGGLGGVHSVVPRGGVAPVAIRAYHGSPNAFEKFDMGRARDGNYGKGVNFHLDKKDAERYKSEGGKIYEADLAISNPFRMDAPVKNKDAIRIAESYGNTRLVEILKETGQDIRSGNELWYWSLGQGGSKDAKARAIQAAGFDAIIGDPGKEIAGKSTRSPEVVVFDPNRISVLGAK